MIKLDLYRVFCEVSKARSFSKAAAVLYMTQPAVSQAIMQLEAELNIRLFTRTPKGVVLTNEGQLLYEHIGPAMNIISTGEKKLAEIRNFMAGELRIGVGDTISRYYLLPYLEKFHRQYPDVRLKVFNGTTIELCGMLKSGEVDLAVCNLPVEDAAFEIIECMDVHDIFVCGEMYRHMTSKPLSLEEISGFPLILLETKSNSRQYVERYLQSKGLDLKPEIELGSHELLLEFARINLGVSCVIKEFSQEYLKSGLLYEMKIAEEIPKRSIGICYLKSIPLSPATERFVRTLELVYT